MVLGDVESEGELRMPGGAGSVMAFAHGSGSSQHSPRNRFVAGELARAGVRTLLVDLLTAQQEQRDLATRALRFDTGLLADRVVGVVDWLERQPPTRSLGESGCPGRRPRWWRRRYTRIASARSCRAAVARTWPVMRWHAWSPRRFDRRPRDEPVIALNRAAEAALAGEARLEVVPEATHLFEEPGALPRGVELACQWVIGRLPGSARA